MEIFIRKKSVWRIFPIVDPPAVFVRYIPFFPGARSQTAMDIPKDRYAKGDRGRAVPEDARRAEKIIFFIYFLIG